jgi:hypothetical protein
MRKKLEEKNVKVTVWSGESISLEEQELHLNACRDSEEILVCSSHRPYITKLMNNPAFVVDEVMLNSSQTGIIQVIGRLPNWALSLRKVQVKRILSDEERKIRADRLRKIRLSVGDRHDRQISE